MYDLDLLGQLDGCGQSVVHKSRPGHTCANAHKTELNCGWAPVLNMWGIDHTSLCVKPDRSPRQLSSCTWTPLPTVGVGGEGRICGAQRGTPSVLT